MRKETPNNSLEQMLDAGVSSCPEYIYEVERPVSSYLCHCNPRGA